MLQILRTLSGESKGWANHPAVKMWKGYEAALTQYGLVVCRTWINMGYKDTCFDKIAAHAPEVTTTSTVDLPTWLGSPTFHRSHRSNLVRKLPEHYRAFWSFVPDDLPYVWPVQ